MRVAVVRRAWASLMVWMVLLLWELREMDGKESAIEGGGRGI